MKILLQILILAIFIFSNGYQSLMTSFMLNPVHRKLLMTVDELLESDLKIGQFRLIDNLCEDNPKYQKSKDEGQIVEFELYQNWIAKMFEMNLAYPKA